MSKRTERSRRLLARKCEVRELSTNALASACDRLAPRAVRECAWKVFEKSLQGAKTSG